MSATYKNNPGCLIQLLWFVLIGAWLGQIWLFLAYLLIVLIVTMPVGFSMLNSLPKILTLREPEREVRVSNSGQGVVTDLPQLPFLLRALYFILIGWWFGLLWLEVAFALCATIIFMPLGFVMFDKTPAVINLRRQ